MLGTVLVTGYTVVNPMDKGSSMAWKALVGEVNNNSNNNKTGQ